MGSRKQGCGKYAAVEDLSTGVTLRLRGLAQALRPSPLIHPMVPLLPWVPLDAGTWEFLFDVDCARGVAVVEWLREPCWLRWPERERYSRTRASDIVGGSLLVECGVSGSGWWYEDYGLNIGDVCEGLFVCLFGIVFDVDYFNLPAAAHITYISSPQSLVSTLSMVSS